MIPDPQRDPALLADDQQAEVQCLRRRIEELEQDKRDLEMMLEMTTEHSDTAEEDLHTKVEEALLESERRLRVIVEATPIPVVISREADDKIVYANAMAGPLLGLPTRTLVGRIITEFYHDPSAQRQLLEMLALEGRVDHREVRFQSADGRAPWVDISMRLLDFNGEASLLSAWHDITHLKERPLAVSYRGNT